MKNCGFAFIIIGGSIPHLLSLGLRLIVAGLVLKVVFLFIEEGISDYERDAALQKPSSIFS